MVRKEVQASRLHIYENFSPKSKGLSNYLVACYTIMLLMDFVVYEPSQYTALHHVTVKNIVH